ncbi:MAG: VCBS repeat-containing protein [Acidobacteriota bacterium]
MIRKTAWLFATALCGVPLAALADGGVTFQDIAADDGAGITYRRAPSARITQRDAAVALSPIPLADFRDIRTNLTPQKGRGNPGVVLFDFDRDGDEDIYVTNGPGVDNSLYVNQLEETGAVTFVDVGGAAGVGAFGQDSAGACAGDIDNDGDQDLLVLGSGEGSRLFENQSDGTFLDITDLSGVGNVARWSTGCSFGDIDNDGLLDVVVANTYDNWNHRIPVFTIGPTYDGMEHNELYLNLGGNTFEDVSASSGIQNVSNMPDAAFSWAIAMVDIDLDGDQDIVSADNQGGAPQDASEERGYNRIFQNDGTGRFTDITLQVGLDIFGGWMGLDFGDLNCDGNLDFFSTNLGYLGPGGQPSRWFFGNDDGTFSDPGVGDLAMTPFGWGTSIFDYDNDGDSDIVYHGGVDLFSLIVEDNPGVLLKNDGNCSGTFSWDSGAFATEHYKRTVQGVAVGDLNGDGFEDIVSVSNFDVVEQIFLLFSAVIGPFGSPFDDVAGIELAFSGSSNPGFQTYTDPTLVDGTLAVEISSGDNGNGWADITTLGTIDLTRKGSVNRDGIGAVVSFTPHGGATALRPIVGGSSYSSQDSLSAHFGMGDARWGTVDVLWPGGVVNRLHYVRPGERIIFPEIPCRFDEPRFGRYVSCVVRSLVDLRRAGVLDRHEKRRFFKSALWAYIEERRNH